MNCKTKVFFLRVSFLLNLLLGVSFSASTLFAQTGDDLDLLILRERIRKAHGDFRLKVSGDWKAALEGRIEPWKWGPKGWSCGSKEAPASCSQWTPQTFSLWQSGSFLDQWIPKKRLAFEVQKAKSQPRARPAGEEGATEAENEEPVTEWGQNWVGELWAFQNAKGDEIRMLVSARDQRIERVEFPSSVEYFEWSTNKAKQLDLAKIIIEKDGTRVMISRK